MILIRTMMTIILLILSVFTANMIAFPLVSVPTLSTSLIKNSYMINTKIIQSPTALSSNAPNNNQHVIMNQNIVKNALLNKIINPIVEQSKIIWNFTRPHTIVGSCISIICLYLYAIPPQYWKQQIFIQSLIHSLVPSLFMNLYITGLNQVTDIEIDKINKPYLPIASGQLSKTNGILVVIGSLLLSLLMIKYAIWPLQCTVIGSAILGTMYSLSPFRLKRFPLLAAFCILVVRGSLVNLGFFLQAKLTILHSSSHLSTNIFQISTLSNLCNTVGNSINMFPEGKVLNIFFAIFGLVIALMKDVPDIRGDIIYKIPSFSVKLGAKKMFRIAYRLLYSLLGFSSIISFLSTIKNINNYIPLFSKAIVKSIFSVFSGSSTIVRISIGVLLGIMTYDVKTRAHRVEAENPDKVFTYYMHIWNIFYTCYLILPFIHI